tara:strand:+ start:596 stop:853 length:258 start_codon:yes stop_codon:yes gene_type:complete
MNDVLKKVKEWLEEEIEENQDVVDAKDNGEDCVTSDGTDDIIYGRHECATGLLEQIKKWEDVDEKFRGMNAQQVYNILKNEECDE